MVRSAGLAQLMAKEGYAISGFLPAKLTCTPAAGLPSARWECGT